MIISHDPFARTAVHRRRVAFHIREECGECNNLARFQYGASPDDAPNRVVWDKKSFCCKKCRDAYYGG